MTIHLFPATAWVAPLGGQRAAHPNTLSTNTQLANHNLLLAQPRIMAPQSAFNQVNINPAFGLPSLRSAVPVNRMHTVLASAAFNEAEAENEIALPLPEGPSVLSSQRYFSPKPLNSQVGNAGLCRDGESIRAWHRELLRQTQSQAVTQNVETDLAHTVDALLAPKNGDASGDVDAMDALPVSQLIVKYGNAATLPMSFGASAYSAGVSGEFATNAFGFDQAVESREQFVLDAVTQFFIDPPINFSPEAAFEEKIEAWITELETWRDEKNLLPAESESLSRATLTMALYLDLNRPSGQPLTGSSLGKVLHRHITALAGPPSLERDESLSVVTAMLERELGTYKYVSVKEYMMDGLRDLQARDAMQQLRHLLFR